MSSKTYRQILINKYPDKQDEIEALDYPGLDTIKCNYFYLYNLNPYHLYILLSCCEYYQEKLDECNANN